MALDAPPDPSTTDVTPRHRAARAVPAIVAAVLAVTWLVMLTVTGSPLGDVLRWSGAVLVGVLAPGLVVVRASRRAAAPLIEDLSWASATGCLVAMIGWLVDRVLPVSPGPLIVGPVVILLGLAHPVTRRRVLARPAPGWGTGPALVLGGVILVAYGWMLETGLLAYKPNPGPHGTVYYQDAIYQLSLVGELRHALVPTYAPVAGAPLHYHWFLYAITAHLLTHTGVDPFDSILRLGPALLVPAILMLAAVVARRLSGWVWAGPLAAGLLGVVDISEASRWTQADGTAGILPGYWWLSPTQTLGWLVSLAVAGCLFAFVRRDPHDAAVPVALFVPLMMLMAGSKSSELPVLLAGIGLATAVQLIRRDWASARRCLLALGLGFAVFVAAVLTIYGTNSYGLKRQLWGMAFARMSTMFPDYTPQPGQRYLAPPNAPGVVIATVALLFLLPQVPRLLGLFFQLRYRAADSSSWICLGTALAGFGLPFVFRHPGSSQLYFLISAYPIGVVGAAAGLSLALVRARQALAGRVARRRFGLWLGGLLVVGVIAAGAVAYVQPRFSPVVRWIRSHPADPRVTGESTDRLAWLWLTPTVTLLIVLGLLAAIAAAVVHRRRSDESTPTGRRAPLIWLSTLSLLLGPGLFALLLHFRGTNTPTTSSVAAVHAASTAKLPGGPLPTMPDEVAAGRYVDAHAGADDVVATNMYCQSGLRPGRQPRANCDARDFGASAFTQRRSLVGGWTYSDQTASEAWSLKIVYHNASFWDSPLLNQEIASYRHPTAAGLDALYRQHHVRWIFVDRRASPVDVAGLDRLADRVFFGRTVAVWKLRTPAG